MSAIASVTAAGASSVAASGSAAVAASSAQQTGASSAASNAYTLSDTLSALISGNKKNQQSATLRLLTGNSASDDSSGADTLITQYQQATNLTYAESQYLQTLQSGATSASTVGSKPTGSSSANSGAYALSASLSALIAENEKNQQSSFVQMLTGTSNSDSSDSETEACNLITQYEQATNVTYPELQYLQTMQADTTTASTSAAASTAAPTTAADTTATTARTNTSAANTSPSIGGQVDVSV